MATLEAPTAPQESPRQAVRPNFGQRARKVLIVVHLWTGLGLGLWFALMGVTGSVVAWRHEISAFEWRSRFPLKSGLTDAPIIPVSKAVEVARVSFPDLPSRALSSIRVPRGDLPVYVFPMGLKGGAFWIAGVDPYTAEPYAPQPLPRFVTWFEDLHTTLLLKDAGNTASGVLALFATFLLVSGLWLWWPRNLKQLKLRLRVKRGVSLARTLGDLHNVMGIYLYPVLLIATITTVHLVANNVLERREQAARPTAPRGGGERGGRARGPRVIPAGDRLPVDRLVESARRATPGDEPVEVALPTRPEAALRVMVRQPRGLTRYANVYVDPYRGNVVQVTRTFNSEGNTPMAELSSGLHYGAYAGPFSKAVYTLAGLTPTGLLVTGFLMWLRKKRKPKRAVPRPSPSV